MSQSVEEYFIDSSDNYKPAIFKESLGQYDNYQIHDLYCDDINYTALEISGRTINPPSRSLMNNFLAVEKVSLYPAIECDFESITRMYP